MKEGKALVAVALASLSPGRVQQPGSGPLGWGPGQVCVRPVDGDHNPSVDLTLAWTERGTSQLPSECPKSPRKSDVW